MILTLQIVGLQAAWWSALAAYLASDRQRLRSEPLSKPLGWGIFTLGSALSFASLAAAHDGLSGAVYWLCAVMVSWVLLVLAVPHASSRAQVPAWGAGLMVAAAVLG